MLAVAVALPARGQNTLHVPGDASSIQAAIDMAYGQDTVLVAPGTYFENIDFRGKTITVQSTDGPDKTIIDGRNLAPVVYIGVPEGFNTATLSGFTVQHGAIASPIPQTGANQVGLGAGINVVGSALLSHNNVTANVGAGIDVFSSGDIRITASHIYGNTCAELYEQLCGTESSGITLHDFPAGRLTMPEDGIIIDRNTIEANDFAGISVRFQPPLNYRNQTPVFILQNVVRRNGVELPTVLQGQTYYIPYGEGIALVSGSSVAVFNNSIYENLLTGLVLGGGRGTIAANNLLYQNGLSPHLSQSGREVTELDVVQTSARFDLKIVNNVIANTHSSTTMVACGSASNYPAPAFDSNLFQGYLPVEGQTSDSRPPCKYDIGQYGEFAGVPHFVSPATYDFHPAPDSPLIDAGVDSVPYLDGFASFTPTDLDDNPRRVDATGRGYPTIDIGPFERQVGSIQLPQPQVSLLPDKDYLFGHAPLHLAARVTGPTYINSGTFTLFVDNQPVQTLPVDPNGNASFTVTGLLAGTRSLYVVYSGSLPYQSRSPRINVLVDLATSQVFLTSSQNPSLPGDSVTFTAEVDVIDGGTLSAVEFSIDGDGPVSVPVDAATRKATYTRADLSLGSHLVTATAPGTGFVQGSSATLTQYVGYLPTTTVVSGSPNPSLTGNSVLFTASVHRTTGAAAAGAVAFTLDNAPLCGALALDAFGNASCNSGPLSTGAHTVVAHYLGAGVLAESFGTLIQQVRDAYSAQLGLSSSGNAFQVSVTGTIAWTGGAPTFNYPGSLSLSSGSQPLASVANIPVPGTGTLVLALPAGTYPVTLTFTPNAASPSVLPVTPLTQTIDVPRAHPALVVQQPSGPLYSGRSVSLSGIVSGVPGHVPTGNLLWTVDGLPVATPLDPNGYSTEALPSLTAGTHTIAVAYTGDSNYQPVSATPFTISVLQRDFRLEAESTLTIPAEHHRSTAVTLASLGDFADTVGLSCQGLPQFATCTFSHSAVALTAGSTNSVTLIVDTDQVPRFKGAIAAPVKTGLPLAACLLPLPALLWLQRRRRMAPIRGIRLLLLVLTAGAALSFTACSGRNPGFTPPGDYTFQVVGSSNSITHSQAIRLMVTPE